MIFTVGHMSVKNQTAGIHIIEAADIIEQFVRADIGMLGTDHQIPAAQQMAPYSKPVHPAGSETYQTGKIRPIPPVELREILSFILSYNDSTISSNVKSLLLSLFRPFSNS